MVELEARARLMYDGTYHRCSCGSIMVSPAVLFWICPRCDSLDWWPRLP